MCTASVREPDRLSPRDAAGASMNVDPTGPVRATQAGRRSERRSGAGSADFARHLDLSGSAPGVSGARQAAPVDALLVAQQVEGDADGDTLAKQRANVILEMLDEIRHAILAGTVDHGRLNHLAVLVRGRRDEAADPRLRAILDEVELRAAVELAKLERARDEAASTLPRNVTDI
jgi:hypothetical protein